MLRPSSSTLFPYTTLFRSPGCGRVGARPGDREMPAIAARPARVPPGLTRDDSQLLGRVRSEEHTSELQSLRQLVCRLLLEKKNRHTRRFRIDVIDIQLSLK